MIYSLLPLGKIITYSHHKYIKKATNDNVLAKNVLCDNGKTVNKI